MQYEIVFKSDGWCPCYICLPQTIPTATQTDLKMVAAPGTGTDATPGTRQQHKHTCKQRLTLRNSTSIHKTARKTKLELFYALQ